MRKQKPSKQAEIKAKRESNNRDSKGDFTTISKERFNDLILSERYFLKLRQWSFKGSKKKSDQWQKDTFYFLFELIQRVKKLKGINEKLLFHGFSMEFEKIKKKRKRDSPKQELFKAWVKRNKEIDPMLPLDELHLLADEAFERKQLPVKIGKDTIYKCLPDIRKK
jgi:hypothetical protein